MPRSSASIVVSPPKGWTREDMGYRLAVGLLRNKTLPIRKVGSRYVIRYGSPLQTIGTLPADLTKALDNEYSVRAVWAVTRIFPKNQDRVVVQIKRVEPRHGFVGTYQNHHCRCADCTAANTAAALEYRHRTNPPRAPQPRKHGAHCWKYGCFCEARREADRVRQARRRERLRQAALEAKNEAEAPGKVAGTANAKPEPSGKSRPRPEKTN